ncbi:DNA/RNA non-specific endonuclease [Saccharicrinis fermentans]|uniref:Nuclease n=1 Tax=Saccharicrinis fermentans DSM 9555 = JCM 21142 TaxID=869213 RepID=W7XVR2_9BACT|nr:DNA/RNA non-specific endonuclease [Saccharicrinis fermentans]GAF02285.1 nuclease precursor [Saccharicrinis fermentans DSM 9555 = JCM 21142]
MDSKIDEQKLKDFVRKHAPSYLKQANVNSVGLAYKIENGKRTDQLAIQFTVCKKVALESLESINEVPIPASFQVDGKDIPSDIIERDYDINPVKMIDKTKGLRKQFLDPILPGCSIGHPTISAGTAGCVVFDKYNGEEYILSNWHVLQGSRGNIGDRVVQPGMHDDARKDRNDAGVLVNSHLGLAGDCAIAKMDKRKVDGQIIDLDVCVENISAPWLGDKVMKSGRTTSLTFGIVTRIDVTTKMNYGAQGDINIGCFEYTPDPDHLPFDGEISMGGDSGAAVMLADDSKATSTMLGLHFAGEVGNAPEHALACYATSVFEKLNISAKPPTQAAVLQEIKKGYDSNFLSIPLRSPYPVNEGVFDELLKHKNENVFDYMHYSLVLHRERKLAAWVAWNIDGGHIKKVNRVDFKKDPHLPMEAQIGNELYKHNDLDRGHMARRAELCWGTLAEAKKANDDSFYYTNIAPQHKRFNQSHMYGVWGQLENAVFDQAKIKDLKVSVMAGPLFNESDPIYRGVKIPKEYWKVICYVDEVNNQLVHHCFILTQSDLVADLERLDFDAFKLFKVSISTIAEKSNFKIVDLVSKESVETIEEVREIFSVYDIFN